MAYHIKPLEWKHRFIHEDNQHWVADTVFGFLWIFKGSIHERETDVFWCFSNSEDHLCNLVEEAMISAEKYYQIRLKKALVEDDLITISD